MISDVLQRRAGLQSSGDFTGYRRYCTRRLKKLRQRKNLTCKASKAYEPKELGASEWELVVLLSERAWAGAMAARAAIEANAGSRSTLMAIERTKFSKAVKHAKLLLSAQPAGQDSRQSLESHVYLALVKASARVRGSSYESALECYARARVGLLALAGVTKTSDENLFSDYISSTVDAGLRLTLANAEKMYTADYSSDLAEASRQIVLNDKKVPEFVDLVRAVYPKALSEETAKSDLSQIQFRQHTAEVKYKKLAEVILSAKAKSSELDEQLKRNADSANFESVMADWDQLVFDTSSLIADINSTGQEREQDLDIILTYAQYSLLFRRIQRDSLAASKDFGKPNAVRLYDVVLQSCRTMGELPGIFNDEELSSAITCMQAFFTAKRLLALASLHPSGSLEALALVNQAHKEFVRNEDLSMTSGSSDLPVSSTELIEFKSELSRRLVQTHGVTVLIQEVKNRSRTKGSVASDIDFVQIEEPGKQLRVVDLEAKVIDPVPVKPVFYDIAFNYLQEVSSSPASVPSQTNTAETQPTKKKGLFGLF